ncbi:DNA-directed RNA polymerase subunit K [Candidatus Woesearchaeota archaeon]|nr:DNA-directed RNA polymerase subunit K [Candidatus Woesearchaeota archaeon]
MEEYTKYEHARIVGARALQISMGAPFMMVLTDDDLRKLNFNPIEIAKIEFSKGLIPISVKRPMPGALRKLEPAKPFDQTKLE